MRTSGRDIDKGWAWVALGASFFCLFACAGLAYVAGIFQMAFLDAFEGSVSLTSWVTALFNSLMQMGGPISSLVMNLGNCRWAVIIGGALLAFGMTLSGLMGSLTSLLVTFGVIAGLGLGLTYTASVVVVSYFFNKRRNIATGIALSASGLGLFFVPQITIYLLENFSLRETLIYIGAASAHICVAGSLMFPLNERQAQYCKNSDKCRLCNSKYKPEFTKGTNSEVTSETDVFLKAELLKDQDGSTNLLRTNLFTKDSNMEQNLNTSTKYDTANCEKDHDISTGNVITSILNKNDDFNEQFKQINNTQNLNEEISIKQRKLSNVNDLNSFLNSSSKSVGKDGGDFMDKCSNVSKSRPDSRNSNKIHILALLRNKAFHILLLNLFLCNAACGMFNIHLPGFALKKGLTEAEVTNILSLNGLALFCGRFLVGALANGVEGSELLIYWALHILGGICVCILPLTTTGFLGASITVLLIGTYFGSVYSVLTPVTLQYVELEQLATAMGVEMVFGGLGYFISPPIAGLLVDKTGSYDYNMFCGGALLISSGMVLFCLTCFEKNKDPEHKEEEFEEDIHV